MQKPVVTVIIPTFNSAAFIVDSIQSVLAQSFQAFEIIVVDDASQDGTVSLVRSFQEARLSLIELPHNRGPAAARNAGIHQATGRFLAFLDSDDLWHPRKLELQLQAMQAHSYEFTYTLYDIVDPGGVAYAMSGNLPSTTTYAGLLPHCFIRTSSIVYDTVATGGKIYCPDIRKRQDFGLFLALLKRVGHARLIDRVLCSYRVRPHSVSSNKLSNIRYQWRVLHAIERLGLVPSSYYLSRWLLQSGLVTTYRAWCKAKKRWLPDRADTPPATVDAVDRAFDSRS